MRKISANLKEVIYSKIKEDEINQDMLAVTIDKDSDEYDEFVTLYKNNEEFDAAPLSHVRIISITETKTDATFSFIFDPIVLRGKNDKYLFKNMNIELFIKKNRWQENMLISNELIEFIDKNKKVDRDRKKLIVELVNEDRYHKELVKIFTELFKFRTSPMEFEKIKVDYVFNLGDLKNIILEKRTLDLGKEIFEFSFSIEPPKQEQPKKKKFQKMKTGNK